MPLSSPVIAEPRPRKRYADRDSDSGRSPSRDSGSSASSRNESHHRGAHGHRSRDWTSYSATMRVKRDRTDDSKPRRDEDSSPEREPSSASWMHSSSMCNACARIDVKSTYGMTHLGYKERAWSVKFGCKLCALFQSSMRHEPYVKKGRSAEVKIDHQKSLLWYKTDRTQAFEIFAAEDAKESMLDIYHSLNNPPPQPSFLTSEAGTRKESLRSGLAEGAPPPPPPPPTDLYLIQGVPMVLYRPISTTANSDVCISIAKEWLDRCKRTHHHCRRGLTDAMPKRVLAVTDNKLKLIQDAPKAPYAILSYCWGPGSTLKTTAANIESFRDTMDLDALPATIRDAISIARGLSIPYLWVDAFCIVQDSSNDWKVECSRMGSYYQNAYLTISALDATEVAAGFLQQRPSKSVALPQSGFRIRPRRELQDRPIQSAALSQRGWTLQERLLSRCILHFTKEEMLWECLTCSAAERSMAETREIIDASELISHEGDDFKRALYTRDKDPFAANGVFPFWYRTLKQFTSRNLSFSSDKLAAVEGLARNIQRDTRKVRKFNSKGQSEEFEYVFGRDSPGDEQSLRYSYGMWLEDLSGLLWRRSQTSLRKDGHSKHDWDRFNHPDIDKVVPRWSWAAMQAPIQFELQRLEKTSSKNDATLLSCTPAETPARLEILAQVVPVRCKWSLEECCQITGDIYSESGDLGCGAIWMDNGVGPGPKRNLYGEVTEERWERCEAIRIGTRKSYGSYPKDYFILVQRAKQKSELKQPPHTKEPVSYQRIGMGWSEVTETSRTEWQGPGWDQQQVTKKAPRLFAEDCSQTVVILE